MSRPVGILGLGRSGRAAALLALSRGERVFVSDSGDSPELRAAAEEVRAAGGVVQLGGHTIDALADCALIVLSPGIAPDSPVLRDARVRAVPLISEIEYAFRALPMPAIAVTGTNGKSTTAALIAHLLAESGFDAPVAGNIGVPLSRIALRSPDDSRVRSRACAVVEVSSFQLATIERFEPVIGVVTNLSPDHLERYASVEAYYADKARLFDNASASSVWVLNADDAAVLALPGESPGERLLFSTRGELAEGEQGGFLRGDGMLVLRRDPEARQRALAHIRARISAPVGEMANGAQPERTALGETGLEDVDLVPASALELRGEHNHANALAAAVAASAAGAPAASISRGLRTFAGLEHRLETVLERGGVLWINDSKATNVGSTLVALRSMTRPTVLLLGGRHKGEPYATLLPELRRHVRHVLAFGEAAPLIEEELSEHVSVERVDGSFEQVVARAARVAAFGDTVLLSPACASFDMFRDYEERGRRFKELAGPRVEVPNG